MPGKAEAVVACPPTILRAEQITLGIPVGDQVFEVTNEEGLIVFALAFRHILHS